LAALVGCQAPPQPSVPTELVVRIPDYEQFVERSLSVLRQNDFPPQHVDREQGRIISQPSTGGQWFEWWRHDIHGGYQMLESNLQTIRRIVLVSVERLDDQQHNDQYRLTVEVEKSRWSTPERQVTTASGAMAIYSDRLPTTGGLRPTRQKGDHWIPLGRDALLEAYLLDKLVGASPGVEAVTQTEPAPATSTAPLGEG
jgi:hypothetical protein